MLIDANLTLMALGFAIVIITLIWSERRIDKRLDKQDERFSAIEKSLSEVKTELAAQSQRLDNQSQRLDEQSQRLGEQNQRFDRIDERFERQSAEINEVGQKVVRVEGIVYALVHSQEYRGGLTPEAEEQGGDSAAD